MKERIPQSATNKMAESIFEEADTIAERVTALGGTALGTARMAASASTLPAFPNDVFDGSPRLGVVIERWAQFAASARVAGEICSLHKFSPVASTLARTRPGASLVAFFCAEHRTKNVQMKDERKFVVCQQVVFLAEREGMRYVSQCEHGTVHLVWDAVGFHLPAAAFVQIAERILQTATRLMAQREAPEGSHCLLQVGRITVTLPPGDFLPLAQMLEEALPLVAVAKFTSPLPLPRLTFPSQPITPLFN